MMSKHYLSCVVYYCLVFYSTVCSAESTRILITGSSTVAPLMLEIAKRYESIHPNVRIDVQTGGSSRGIADVRRGLAEIGMVSRDLKKEENDLTSFPVALDGIGVILNKKNRVTNLSNSNIVDIYTGKIANWKEVGGDDQKITVVHKAEGRSTLELFLKYFELNNSDIKPHIIIGENQQGIKTVSGNTNAIGYVSIGAAEYESLNGSMIKMLPMNGIPASVANVLNGSFPLSRRLNLVTKGNQKTTVVDFIKYSQKETVNDLIKAQYFVPITH